MYLFHVNFPAVILSALLCMWAGSVWYSDRLFARQWMAALGKRKDDLKAFSMNYLVVGVCFLVMAFVFGKILYYTRVSDLWGSIEIALLVWIAFIFTTTGINYLFEGKSRKLFFINTGYHLLSILIMSIVLGIWK